MVQIKSSVHFILCQPFRRQKVKNRSQTHQMFWAILQKFGPYQASFVIAGNYEFFIGIAQMVDGFSLCFEFSWGLGSLQTGW